MNTTPRSRREFFRFLIPKPTEATSETSGLIIPRRLFAQRFFAFLAAMALLPKPLLSTKGVFWKNFETPGKICTPGYDCGSVTRASIRLLTPGQVMDLFKPGGVFDDFVDLPVRFRPGIIPVMSHPSDLYDFLHA